MRLHRTLLATVIVAAALAVAVFHTPFVQRLLTAHRLFEPDHIVHNFTHMAEIFPSRKVAASSHPLPLERGQPVSLPEHIDQNGSRFATRQFLQDTGTTGLIVIHNDRIVSEQYFQGHTADEVHISWSLAKSMISAMIGIAVHEGRITSVDDPVDRYARELRGTAYEGVPLRDVLQMSSGVHFDENYDDPNSDIVQVARASALSGSFNAYARKLTRDIAPGTRRRYSSYDTQVLAMVLRGATGAPLAEVMQTCLWEPLGSEHNAWWLLDGEDMEMGFGGFNATLRDFARFGQLYLHHGEVGGHQVVPAEWVSESLRMSRPHLQPHRPDLADSVLGYGYQWWIPDDAARDFMAIGVYNQFIYVSPETHTVIVKNSANWHYSADDYELTMQHLALFRAIAAAASSP